MKKRKILVITNMYPTDQHKSFGVFVKNQVDALRKAGLEIDVLAITNPLSGKKNVIIKYVKWLFQAIYYLIVKGKSYGVVHAHYVFPSGKIGLLFKKIYKTRLIVTAHGGDIDKMARKNKWIYNSTKKILSEADHVISVGEQLFNTIHQEFDVSKEKHSIINMGVNRNIFKPIPKSDAKIHCGISSDEKIILFVGNIIEQKGLIELIDAFSMLKDRDKNYLLCLIGATNDPTFKHHLDEKLQTLGLVNDVRLLGVKSQIEIAQWMSAAEVLVLPSHIEGFGLVALEAMSCETPVIGTAVGGLKYLLANNTGKIVKEKNAADLYQGLSQLLASDQEKNALIQNGLRKAEDNDQNKLIKQVIEVYFPTGG